LIKIVNIYKQRIQFKIAKMNLNYLEMQQKEKEKQQKAAMLAVGKPNSRR
tara:strand:+ start:32 stop:181 length:150 start_codon:yes stop_codon:yes gene_type:complete